MSTFGSPKNSSNRSNKLQRSNSSDDDEFENTQKRRKMTDFKFKPSQTSTQLSQENDVFAMEEENHEEPKPDIEDKPKYKPKPFQAPSKIEEPSDPIDAYFASMQRKNPVYARERPNPEAKIK